MRWRSGRDDDALPFADRSARRRYSRAGRLYIIGTFDQHGARYVLAGPFKTVLEQHEAFGTMQIREWEADVLMQMPQNPRMIVDYMERAAELLESLWSR